MVPAPVFLEVVTVNKKERTRALDVDRVRDASVETLIGNRHSIRVIAQSNQNGVRSGFLQPGWARSVPGKQSPYVVLLSGKI